MNRKIFIITLLLSIVLKIFAQSSDKPKYQHKGINFEEGSNWKQIKEKAQRENKYIFVDCYTTWCIPCKMMDRNVYSSEKVGDFFNRQFISVKVQMDKSKTDNESVRKWYTIAQDMIKEHKITAFPTFLFFSPEGRMVYRDIGYKSANELIALGVTASDSSNQYDRLLTEYQKGKKDTTSMKQLSLLTKQSGDKNLSMQIANDYLSLLKENQRYTQETLKFIKEFPQSARARQVAENYLNNYLDKLTEQELCRKETLELVSLFPQVVYSEGSKGKFFSLFYNNAKIVDDSIGYNGFASSFVERIIKKEEIDNTLWKDNKPATKSPNWSRVRYIITQKYNSKLAEKIISHTQVTFYKQTKDWTAFAKSVEGLIKKYPPKRGENNFSHAVGGIADIGEDPWGLNVVAWDVFLDCNNKSILKKALSWSELSIRLEEPEPNLQYLDTKANLLYKLGKVKEAITLEEKVIKLDNNNADRLGYENFVSEYADTLNKMKKGQPTWKIKEL